MNFYRIYEEYYRRIFLQIYINKKIEIEKNSFIVEQAKKSEEMFELPTWGSKNKNTLNISLVLKYQSDCQFIVSKVVNIVKGKRKLLKIMLENDSVDTDLLKTCSEIQNLNYKFEKNKKDLKGFSHHLEINLIYYTNLVIDWKKSHHIFKKYKKLLENKKTKFGLKKPKIKIEPILKNSIVLQIDSGSGSNNLGKITNAYGRLTTYGFSLKDLKNKNMEIFIPKIFREAHKQAMENFLKNPYTHFFGKELKSFFGIGDKFVIPSILIKSLFTDWRSDFSFLVLVKMEFADSYYYLLMKGYNFIDNFSLNFLSICTEDFLPQNKHIYSLSPFLADMLVQRVRFDKKPHLNFKTTLDARILESPENLEEDEMKIFEKTSKLSKKKVLNTEKQIYCTVQFKSGNFSQAKYIKKKFLVDILQKKFSFIKFEYFVLKMKIIYHGQLMLNTNQNILMESQNDSSEYSEQSSEELNEFKMEEGVKRRLSLKFGKEKIEKDIPLKKEKYSSELLFSQILKTKKMFKKNLFKKSKKGIKKTLSNNLEPPKNNPNWRSNRFNIDEDRNNKRRFSSEFISAREQLFIPFDREKRIRKGELKQNINLLESEFDVVSSYHDKYDYIDDQSKQQSEVNGSIFLDYSIRENESIKQKEKTQNLNQLVLEKKNEEESLDLDEKKLKKEPIIKQENIKHNDAKTLEAMKNLCLESISRSQKQSNSNSGQIYDSYDWNKKHHKNILKNSISKFEKKNKSHLKKALYNKKTFFSKIWFLIIIISVQLTVVLLTTFFSIRTDGLLLGKLRDWMSYQSQLNTFQNSIYAVTKSQLFLIGISNGIFKLDRYKLVNPEIAKIILTDFKIPVMPFNIFTALVIAKRLKDFKKVEMIESNWRKTIGKEIVKITQKGVKMKYGPRMKEEVVSDYLGTYVLPIRDINEMLKNNNFDPSSMPVYSLGQNSLEILNRLDSIRKFVSKNILIAARIRNQTYKWLGAALLSFSLLIFGLIIFFFKRNRNKLLHIFQTLKLTDPKICNREIYILNKIEELLNTKMKNVYNDEFRILDVLDEDKIIHRADKEFNKFGKNKRVLKFLGNKNFRRKKNISDLSYKKIFVMLILLAQLLYLIHHNRIWAKPVFDKGIGDFERINSLATLNTRYALIDTFFYIKIIYFDWSQMIKPGFYCDNCTKRLEGTELNENFKKLISSSAILSSKPAILQEGSKAKENMCSNKNSRLCEILDFGIPQKGYLNYFYHFEKVYTSRLNWLNDIKDPKTEPKIRNREFLEFELAQIFIYQPFINQNLNDYIFKLLEFTNLNLKGLEAKWLLNDGFGLLSLLLVAYVIRICISEMKKAYFVFFLFSWEVIKSNSRLRSELYRVVGKDLSAFN